MNWTASNDEDIHGQGYTVLPRPVSTALIGLATRLIDEDFAKSPPRTANNRLPFFTHSIARRAPELDGGVSIVVS